MNKALVKTEETIRDLLVKKETEIKDLLPSHVDVNRFIKSALLAVARDTKLQECTPKSLFTAIVNAAELGLDFTPAKGQAYLIAYGKEATFMPGYRGLIDLALRAGKVKQIDASVVRDKDLFKLIKGTNPQLIHEPYLDGDNGDVKGAYAVAFYGEDTPPQFVYMNMKDLTKVKNCSKSKDSKYSPYNTFEEEMQRKAPVRRLFKYVPSSPDLDKAMEYDNKATGIDFIETGGDNRISRTAVLAESIQAQSNTDVAEEPVISPILTSPPKTYLPPSKQLKEEFTPDIPDEYTDKLF